MNPHFGQKSTLKMVLIFLAPFLAGIFLIFANYIDHYRNLSNLKKEEAKISFDLKQVVEILEKAKNLELYSLNPDPQDRPLPNSLYRYRILQKINATEQNVNTVKLSLKSTFTETPKGVAACFNPRHAIRIQLNEKNIDLLICFECAKTLVKGFDHEFYLYHNTTVENENFLSDQLDSKNKFKNSSLNELYHTYKQNTPMSDYVDIPAIIGLRIKEETATCNRKVIREQIKFILDTHESADTALRMNLVLLLKICETILIEELSVKSKNSVAIFHDRLEWGVANETYECGASDCLDLNIKMRSLSRKLNLKSNLDNIFRESNY